LNLEERKAAVECFQQLTKGEPNMASVLDCLNYLNQLQGLIQQIQSSESEVGGNPIDTSPITTHLASAVTAANTLITSLGTTSATDEQV
jgi:hypothetical protein